MFYFAYGALVNREQIEKLSPGARDVRRAKIPNHALCFTGDSPVWEGGTATIGLAPEEDLWGALYEIDEQGRAAIERFGQADGYVWAFTLVEDAHGDRITAGLLVKVRDLEPSDPSVAYLEVLKAGWRSRGLDPETPLHDDAPIL